MNNLRIIQRHIAENPEIVLVAGPVREGFQLPGIVKSPHWTEYGPSLESYRFDIAPKQGLYTPEELQEFMERAIPFSHLMGERSNYEPFYLRGRHLRLGHYSYDEKIGNGKLVVRRLIHLTDEDSQNEAGLIKGKASLEESIDELFVRRTFVVVFPNKQIGRALTSQKEWHGYELDMRTLDRHIGTATLS